MTEPSTDDRTLIRDLSDDIANRVGTLANDCHRPELPEPTTLAERAEAIADDLIMVAGWLRALPPTS